MSNFAAMSDLDAKRLSPTDSGISKIIDGFSNANYVLWEVSVKFSIVFPLILLQLREIVQPVSVGESRPDSAFCRDIPD
jgi:hypothetical protein